MTRDLTPLLAPRSIAIVGASESTDSWAPEIERSLRHVGFRGDLFPVNPKYETVWGRPCVASVGDLPRGVAARALGTPDARSFAARVRLQTAQIRSVAPLAAIDAWDLAEGLVALLAAEAARWEGGEAIVAAGGSAPPAPLA